MNTKGEVAGVVLLDVGGEKGVSYAWPSELIEKVLRDYAKHGKVQPAWVGIGLALGTTTPSIVSLSDDSPAKAAGLQPGDVIRSIGKRPIQEYQDVVDACYYLTAGEAVSFAVMRGLNDLTVNVVPSIRSERDMDKPLDSGAKGAKAAKESEPGNGSATKDAESAE